MTGAGQNIGATRPREKPHRRARAQVTRSELGRLISVLTSTTLAAENRRTRSPAEFYAARSSRTNDPSTFTFGLIISSPFLAPQTPADVCDVLQQLYGPEL